jgi:uncharacterized membrane protein YebE (DUF533 family)
MNRKVPEIKVVPTKETDEERKRAKIMEKVIPYFLKTKIYKKLKKELNKPVKAKVIARDKFNKDKEIVMTKIMNYMFEEQGITYIDLLKDQLQIERGEM